MVEIKDVVDSQHRMEAMLWTLLETYGLNTAYPFWAQDNSEKAVGIHPQVVGERRSGEAKVSSSAPEDDALAIAEAQQSCSKTLASLRTTSNQLASISPCKSSLPEALLRRAQAAEKKLIANEIDLAAAVDAYTLLHNWSGTIPHVVDEWKLAKIAAGKHIIRCCCLKARSIDWAMVESVLLQAFGEDCVGIAGYDQDLRSQMVNAFDFLFPRARPHRKRCRKNAKKPKMADEDAFVEAAEPSTQETQTAERSTQETQTLTVPTTVCTVVKNTFIDARSDDGQMSQGKQSQKSWPACTQAMQDKIRGMLKLARRHRCEVKVEPEITGKCPDDGQVATLDNGLPGNCFDCITDSERVRYHLEHTVDISSYVENLFSHMADCSESFASSCTSLGQFVRTRKGKLACERIAGLLVDAYGTCESEEHRLRCLHAILETCRGTSQMLGLAPSQCGGEFQDECFRPELRARIHRITTIAFKSPQCQHVSVRVLARTQALGAVLEFVGSNAELLAAVLEELFLVLEDPIKCLSQDHDVTGKEWACDLLGRVSGQLAGQTAADAARLSMGWVREVEFMQGGRHWMVLRFVLVAVVCGSHSMVQLLTAATDTRDEKVVEAAARALGLIIDQVDQRFGDLVRCQVNKLVGRCGGRLWKEARAAKAALVGLVASVNRNNGSRVPDPDFDRAMDAIFCYAIHNIGDEQQMYRAKSLHYEVVWALVEIFEGAATLGKWTDRVHQVASSLLRQWEDGCDGVSETVEITEYSRRLLRWEDVPERSPL